VSGFHEKEEKLAQALVERLAPAATRTSFRDQEVVTVPRERAKEALRAARDELGFAMLTDVTAVDTLKEESHPERFAVVWSLLNLAENARLRIRAYVPEDDARVDTCSDLWPAADWGERECFDMFGIRFDGHKDLRRILMPDSFSSFPLRKEYPVRGRGERDDFPVLRRSGET
jgi:NADH-quinone oxidoreductase subunit C